MPGVWGSLGFTPARAGHGCQDQGCDLPISPRGGRCPSGKVSPSFSITEDPGIPASALCLLPGKAGTTLTFCSSGHLLMKSPKSRGPGHPRQSLTILPPRHTCTLRCSTGSSQSTHLGRHSVADIHDGNVLCVWTLIETQIGLQRVLQLNIRAGAATPKRKEQRNKYIKSGETSFPLTQAPFP